MMEISTKEKDLKEVSAKHIKGYVYLAVTIVLYLIGPFLIKETYINAKTRYKKPFFIGYFCSGCFLVYIFPLLFRRIYLSLIHICRCRRYAVCRSRWSPYH
eukprot:TRINITY_DN15159_c0_g1_i2.p1 TRINITY_DN15159_c0_g1~~TRINITY_DN15159_c0_g1_i2.p1  ORF type:complete len:101 (-),score=25.38 TRINITY_DN15159_c0_g1_i2:17-319(-)